MKSVGTARFWQCYRALPRHVRQQARLGYHLWQRNPLHPSLRFKKLRGFDDRWSVRIGGDYRALARVSGDTVEWYWIGSHQDYNQLV